LRLFWILYLRWKGWKAVGRFPYKEKKCLLLVAPHTSSADFIIGLAFRSVLRLTHVRFLGKQELFRPPFGFLFRWLGGTPVDRFAKHNMVEQVIEKFRQNDRFVLALSPEGTRSRVTQLRSGFYHIARQAGVPLVLIGLDFGKKELKIGEPFYAGEDMEKTIETVISFFGPLQGKIPEKGLGHLLKG
jgi:1-acyl-sn-glycerol-3-phosphate acyltransferase